MSVGVVLLFAIPAVTFSTQYLLGTFWGWLMGPHDSLSLWGSTGCPALQWNKRITKEIELLRQQFKLVFSVSKPKCFYYMVTVS